MKMQVVGVSTNVWDGQWMNRQHLMWAMKERASVLYVQEPDPWYAGHRPRDERLLWSTRKQVHPSLAVLRLPKMLCRRSAEGRWNRTTDRLKAFMINRCRGEFNRRILYFWHPELWTYARALNATATVFHIYDLVDEYHEPSFSESPIRKAFLRACEAADVVVAGTKEQANIVPTTNVTIVPNGVCWEWYAHQHQAPSDISRIPRPRIGYVGRISTKVDFEWIENLATCQKWHVVLVGPVHGLAIDVQWRFERLCSLGNVHYLGPKRPQEVPAYMQALDVGLMCYTRGLHCEGASPLKLYEYSAAGLPVVGSRLGSLTRDPEIVPMVRLVDNPQEAFEAVEDALAQKRDPEERHKRLAFAERNSWAKRAEVIMGLIASLPQK